MEKEVEIEKKRAKSARVKEWDRKRKSEHFDIRIIAAYVARPQPRAIFD